jgi:hypothetical protein
MYGNEVFLGWLLHFWNELAHSQGFQGSTNPNGLEWILLECNMDI